MNAVFVFLGGGLGSLLRFGVYRLINYFSLPSWPATLIVNVIGSLIIVGLGKTISSLPEAQQSFLRVGLLGGLTTFSTFSSEIYSLIKSGNLLIAVTVLLLNITFGILVGVFLFK